LERSTGKLAHFLPVGRQPVECVEEQEEHAAVRRELGVTLGEQVVGFVTMADEPLDSLSPVTIGERYRTADGPQDMTQHHCLPDLDRVDVPVDEVTERLRPGELSLAVVEAKAHPRRRSSEGRTVELL